MSTTCKICGIDSSTRIPSVRKIYVCSDCRRLNPVPLKGKEIKVIEINFKRAIITNELIKGKSYSYIRKTWHCGNDSISRVNKALKNNLKTAPQKNKISIEGYKESNKENVQVAEEMEEHMNDLEEKPKKSIFRRFLDWIKSKW